MTFIVTSEFELGQVASPNLPLAPTDYDSRYQEQLNNVLRLYFNRLDAILEQLKVAGAIDPGLINNPNGLFFSTVDQTLAAVDTGYPITFNQTYLNNEVALQSGSTSKIEVNVDGVYNFQLSAQLKSSNASAKDVQIWIKRGTTTIGYSSHKYTLEGSDNHMNVNWLFDIDLADGEYIEMYWGANDTNVTLEAIPASAPYPAVASAVMAVNFVARLPDPRPTPP
jgi:small nuclear ribonucleoprotein (snRNP)-like protein